MSATVHVCVEARGDESRPWQLAKDEFLYTGGYRRDNELFDHYRHRERGDWDEEDVPPLNVQHGWPDDLSEGVKALYESLGGHSEGHINLEQFLLYDWYRPLPASTLLFFDQWVKWVDSGDHQLGLAPSGGAGGYGGPKISAEEMLKVVKDYLRRQRSGLPHDHLQAVFGKHAAEAQWTFSTVAQAMNPAFLELLPAMLKLAGGVHNVKNVRLVFWWL